MARDRPSPYKTRRGVRHVRHLFAIWRAQTTEVSVGQDRQILPYLLAIWRSQTTDGRMAAWRGTGPRPTKHGVVSDMSRVCWRLGERKLQMDERRHGEGQALALRNAEGWYRDRNVPPTVGTGPRHASRGAA